MNIAIRYFTRTGNTKKIADAISEALNIPALPVSAPLEEDTEILFLCNSVYARGVAKDVKSFLKEPGAAIGKLVNVSTAAVSESTYAQIVKLASKEKISVYESEFHCRGQYKEKNVGKPDDADIRAAIEFAKNIVSSMSC